MRTFFVWHRTTPTFMDNTRETLAAFPAGFTLIARVESEHEGEIFQLTNSIDGPWYMQPEPRVTLVGDGRATFVKHGGIRSTSVGDVIVEVLAEGKAGETVNARGDRRWTIEGIGLGEF